MPSPSNTRARYRQVRHLQRLILAAAGLGMFVIGSSTAVVALYPHALQLRRDSEAALLTEASVRSQGIARYLTQCRQIAEQISSRTKARESLEAYNRGEQTFEAYSSFSRPLLEDALAFSTDVLCLTRLDIQDRPVISLGEPSAQAVGKAAEHREGIQLYGPLLLDDGRAALAVVSPILTRSRERVGRDIILFQIDPILRILDNPAGMRSTGRVHLGRRIDQEIFLFQLPSERPAPGHIPQRLHISSPLTKLEPGQPLLATTQFGSRDEIFALNDVEGIGWSVIVTMDRSEVYQPLLRQLMPLALVLLFLILLGCLVILQVMQPLSGKMLVHADELQAEIDAKNDVLARELEERLRTAEALRKSDEQLSSIIDNSSAVIYLKDLEGRYLLVNRQYERLFGVTREQIVGKTDFDIFPAPNAQAFRRNDQTVAREDRVLEIQESAPHRDGVHSYVSVKFPLHDPATGKVSAVAGISTDITELIRAQEEIHSKNEELEALLHAASHDLKEPLRAIENFSAIVLEEQRGHLSLESQDYLQRVVKASSRMRVLLDGLLKISRARRANTPPEWIASEQCVNDALERLDDAIRASHARISVRPGLPRMQADPTWLTEAIFNLVSNALKFVWPGTSPEIEIAAYEPGPGDPPGPGLCVRDRGPGVPEELRQKIFQLFQRGVGREVEGSGAGLAIVEAVVRRHGGDTWVQDREGEGAEFVITFPSAPEPTL